MLVLTLLEARSPYATALEISVKTVTIEAGRGPGARQRVVGPDVGECCPTVAHDEWSHYVRWVLERVEHGPFGVAEVGVDPARCFGGLVGDETGVGKLGKSRGAPSGSACL
jgi:hypothetical protein